jgi:hypothetical protein
MKLYSKYQFIQSFLYYSFLLKKYIKIGKMLISVQLSSAVGRVGSGSNKPCRRGNYKPPIVLK